MTKLETPYDACILKAAKDREKILNEKFQVERAKKEKQMAIATEFVIDLLASEKIASEDTEEYRFMNKNYIWNKIRDFHYEHRPLNRMSRKESVTAKFLNYKGKYISGVTFKHFKLDDLETILDVLRKGLRKDGSERIQFVETKPKDLGNTVGTQADYKYRYKMTKPVSVIKTAQSTGLKGKRAPAMKPTTAPEATPVVEPTSGAETGASATKPATAPETTPVVEPTSGAKTGASAKEEAQDAQRVQASEKTAEPAKASEMSQGQA